MEQIRQNRIQIIKNILFFSAYTIWILRAFLNTTYFYQEQLVDWFSANALDVVWLLCILCVAVDFSFERKEILLLSLVVFFYWTCSATGVAGFPTSILLIYAARSISFRKIASWSLFFQACLLTFVVACSLNGVIENQIFMQGERVRYGLGFLYCSYTSHYLLLFLMLYLAISKKIRWYETVLLLAINVIGFRATDTKTDILSLVLMVMVLIILRVFEKKKTCMNIIAYGVLLIPFLFWAFSIWLAVAYDGASDLWLTLDQILNNRLHLGHQAFLDYPPQMFGQKIRWIGGSALTKNPELFWYYNYVDNNYLSITLQRGVLFAFFMCLAYGRAAYLSIRTNQMALAAGLIVFMVIGLVNPEMRNLLYNTFLLVLLKSKEQFEEMKT